MLSVSRVLAEKGKTKHKTNAVTKADAGVMSLDKATKDRIMDVPVFCILPLYLGLLGFSPTRPEQLAAWHIHFFLGKISKKKLKCKD